MVLGKDGLTMQLIQISKNDRGEILAIVEGDSGITYPVTASPRVGGGEVPNDWKWECTCRSTLYGNKWCKHKAFAMDGCCEKRWMVPF